MIYEDIWKGSKHVRIKSDNTTAISYINNAGGLVSDSCNPLSKTMWYHCINGRGWLSAVHIPGKDNETVDYMSRLQNENTEWRLSPIVFQMILEVFFCKPETDLFASCINYQIGQYA